MTEQNNDDQHKEPQEQPILSPDEARKWVDDLLIEQQSE